ncbi:endospore germination permease [Paenibacillus sp. GCM10012307]|uniref:Endospore germination permease n=1 Tax=Paenibacillus roseus TaxID=2798579 RepID=A0A934MPE1_9BACL|nr:endospore germination permease [Paenibacillus roseus]MBJ6360324.1 endospore germination permease [Paenibacillus roseus]
MNNGIGNISFLQLAMIILLMNGLMTHVTINPMLLESAGRDAWISVLATGGLYLPWCALLVLFMRSSGQQKLQPWLAARVGTILSWIILLPLAIQLYLIGGTTILHTAGWTLINYLPATPIAVLAILLGIVCLYYALSGISAIAIGSGVLLPLVVVLGYFVSFANNSMKDSQLLLPVLEHGWQPVFSGMVFAGGGFVELIMIFAIQHRLKKKVKAWQLLLLGAMIVYITLGPIIGAITEFGYKEAAKQMESPYEQWRLVSLGNDIEHVDFLSVMQWLAGAIVRVSFSAFILTDLLPLKHAASRSWMLLLIIASYVVIAMFPIDIYGFYLWMSRFYIPYSLAVAGFTSVTCISLALFSKKSGVSPS